MAFLLLIYFLFDGGRWQLFPVYLLAGILGWRLWRKGTYFSGKPWQKFFQGGLLTLLLGLGVTLATILPIFDLPTPSGAYAVGSQTLTLSSQDSESLTSNPNDHRELLLKLWYPARVGEEPLEPYWPAGDRQGFALKYGLPMSTFHYLNKITTHTHSSPEVAEDRFPVLLFSHGYYSPANAYYVLLEELASQGFFIISINHTYESVGTVFADGQLRAYAKEYERQKNDEAMAALAWTCAENMRAAKTAAEKYAAAAPALRKYYGAEITERWAADIGLVLNYIDELAAETRWKNHLDTAKIGILGHSQGGGAAGQALLDFPRLRAGVNLDGTQWGEMLDTTLTQPFLLLSSDWPADHPDLNAVAYRNGSKTAFYEGRIQGSGHASFMDIPYIVNLSALNESGSIEPSLASEITSMHKSLLFA